MMKKISILFLILLIPALLSAGFDGNGEKLEVRYRSALKRAGDNGTVIEKAVDAMTGNRGRGARLLIADMPVVDLASISDEQIGENVDYAYRAMETFPWGENIPEKIFIHYVLPHRVSQEPLSSWRKHFFETLSIELENIESMEEAVITVNKWCGEKAKFKQTQRRDQGPLVTLKSGFGRCEELVILFVSACRAAGIPARQVWTPYWAHTDNNHAWAEVWIDGKWHYTGAAEPKEVLDSAWFDSPAKRAAFVAAIGYGEFEPEGLLYKKKTGCTIINVTPNYTETGTLKVKAEREGEPVKNMYVKISIFNFGGLRPIAGKKTDGRGEISIVLGDGTYFLSCGDEKGRGYLFCTVEAGETSEYTITADRKDPPSGVFRLTTGTGK